MNFKFVSFVLLICLSWTIYVGGLRCFNCHNVNSGPCFHPVAGKVHIINCEQVFGAGDHICFKTMNSGSGNKVVNRGCIPAQGFSALCAELRAISHADCFRCRDDLCNSSNIISPVNLMLLILSLLMIFKPF